MQYFPPTSLIERGADFVLDGFVYCDHFLQSIEADELLDECRSNIPWNVEIVPLFGKRYVAPRLSCAIAEPGCIYRYRGSQSNTIVFSRKLNRLRRQLEQCTNSTFNFVLANRYRSGNDYVGWHSDDERDMGKTPIIASLSLGATRKFRIVSKATGEKRSILVGHGSLLLMFGESQTRYKHTLAKTRLPVGERINLSFRDVST